MPQALQDIDFKSEKSVTGYMNGIWQGRMSSKYQLERQWFLNIAWYMGQQNLFWNDLRRQLEEPIVPPWRVRMIVNLMQGHIVTRLSKCFKGRPEWDVLPATDDVFDIQISELDKQLLHWRWMQQKMPQKWLDTLFWVFTCGNGFVKTVWDPDAGDPMLIAPDQLFDRNAWTPDEIREGISELKKLMGAEMNSETGNLELALGDTVVSSVSPFDIMVDPLATRQDELTYIVESNIQYVGAIKDRWGKTADKIVSDKGSTHTGYHLNLAQRLRNLTGITRTVVGTDTQHGDDTAVVHELWIKPQGNGKLKNGWFFVICQDRILNGKGKGVSFPYTHGQLPYIHVGEIKVPGRFWYTSTCEQIMPVQSDYNKTKSQLIEIRNMTAKPKYLRPRGSGVGETALTSEPGEIIDHNPNLAPSILEPPTVPSYVANMLQEHRQDLEDITGMHEVSRAEAPGEVRSGKGILALLSQDETRLGPVITHLDEKVAEIGRLVLMTDCQFVTEERLAKIVGEDDELLMVNWSGKQLLGDNYGRPGVDYFDVRVTTIPGMPNSKMAQVSMVENFLTSGVLNAERDRKLIFKLVNLGRVDRQLDKARVHRSKAVKENQQLAKGEQVQVMPWQDHEAHLEVLDEYRNSTEYEQLPPELQQNFTIHEQMHKEMIAMLTIEPQIIMQQAQQKMMMAHGLMPPGGPNGQGQGNGQGSEGNQVPAGSVA